MCLESSKKGQLHLQIMSNQGQTFYGFGVINLKKNGVQGTEHLGQNGGSSFSSLEEL